jgi:Mg2+ and Co2+ transporter CorA
MTRPDYNWKLPPEITERLGINSYGAQRAIFEQGHLLLITHEPPSQDSNERVHAVFLRRPDGRWLYHGAEQGERALVELVDRYAAQLDKQEQAYPQAASADDLFELMDRLLPLSRAASHLRDALQSAREMVKEDRLLIDQRDRAVEVARGFELMLTSARVALDHRLARHAEEQTVAAMAATRAQLKLNTLASITFPVMTLAAVLGMNLQHGLEGRAVWVFWLVFGLGLALGLWVKGWVRAESQVSAPHIKPKAQKKPGKPAAQASGKALAKEAPAQK